MSPNEAVVVSQVSGSALQKESEIICHPSWCLGEYKYSVTIFYQFLLIAHGPMALWVILRPSPLTFLSLCHSHSAKSSLSKQEQWLKPRLFNPLVFFSSSTTGLTLVWKIPHSQITTDLHPPKLKACVEFVATALTREKRGLSRGWGC